MCVWVCVCVCVCVGLTLSTQAYSRSGAPQLPPRAESQEQPTQVAHLKYKHTKTCYFNWPSSHQAVNDLSSVLLVVFSFFFSKASCMVMNIWFRMGEGENGGKWYARAFSRAVFLVQVRQPAAFMEMDWAEGGTAAAAVFSPQTPDSGELESTLTDLVFLCERDQQTFILRLIRGFFCH